METQEIKHINVTERADSIEWRLSTGKSVKVYGNVENKEDFKNKLKTAIDILKEIDKEKIFRSWNKKRKTKTKI